MDWYNLTQKPWTDAGAEIPRNLYFPKGMLGAEEREALYWFARELVVGDGHIIDAGAFLGTSAYALAAGLAHARNPGAQRSQVHSYDLFVAFEQYTADWISEHFGGGLGQPFRDIFDYQTAAYQNRITVHEGDLLDQQWSGEPVEILFIDLAKSKQLNSHIVRQWFDCLIAQHSIIVNQDFFISRHPWIPITMEYLKDYFEILDPHIHWCSRAYRFLKPIPREMIQRLVNYDFTRDEERDLLSSYIKNEPVGKLRQMAHLISIVDRLGAGEYEMADKELAAFGLAETADQDPIILSEIEWIRSWRKEGPAGV